MPSTSLCGQVALVTGASRGLGRVFALALADAGARVVVNASQSRLSAANVVNEIEQRGGQAVVEIASVTDPAACSQMISRIMARWGRIDILVNNAGFAIDKTFAKISLEQFQQVMDVHIGGAARCSHLVWPIMLSQGYGRIVMITSASGLAGNFGQSAYGAAKMAMIGLMNNLGLEGARKGIKVNSFAPVGITDLNREIIDDELHHLFAAQKLSPGIVFLASKDAPNQCILSGGAGSFERIYFSITQGATAGTVEELAERFEAISDSDRQQVLTDISQQMTIEIENNR